MSGKRPISETDVWRHAHDLIQQFGDDARLYASRRADLMLEQGDVEGSRGMIAVLLAIETIQTRERKL